MKLSSKSLIIFIFLVFCFLFSAKEVFPGWFKHYGGTSSDNGQFIQQTSDGGYIVTGYTNSYTHGGDDFAIYRLDSNGDKVWFKHYGGTENDRARSIQQTSDVGYIVAGETNSYTHGNYDFAIYKLDSSGTKAWFKHYGGGLSDYAYSILQISDGSYVTVGLSYSYTYGNADFAAYKLDSSGNKEGFKHYGGTSDDRGLSIQQTSDSGYIMAGSTSSYTHGDYDFAIYKLDSEGNKVWFKHYGGANTERGFFIQQTSDGGYITTGYTNSYTHGGYDFAIYKLDSSGNKVWFKHYGGASNDYGYSIQQTSDGGYIVAGQTSSFTNGDTDFAIYKLNSSGNKTWFKHYGGANSDHANSIQQTSDGGYIVAGSSKSYSYGSNDFAIYKLDSNGDK